VITYGQFHLAVPDRSNLTIIFTYGLVLVDSLSLDAHAVIAFLSAAYS